MGSCLRAVPGAIGRPRLVLARPVGWGEEGKNRAQGSPLLITLEACMGEAALRIPFAES